MAEFKQLVDHSVEAMHSFGHSLERSLKTCDQIVEAAHSCQRNLSWIRHHGSEALLILDFDVVCGALPSLALGEYLSAATGKIDAPQFNLVGPLPGPRELRSFLINFKNYTLAPGAVAELLDKRRAIEAALRRKSAGFVEMLNFGGGTRQWRPELLRALTLHDLWSELQSFVGQLDDADFLTRFVSQCVPYKEVVKRDIPSGTKTAFTACWQDLSRRRPEQSLNNYNDALNVATVIQLFSDDDGYKYLPVLISQTNVISRSRHRFYRFLHGKLHRPPDLFTSRIYMAIYQSVMAESDGVPEAALTYARQLRRRASKLTEAFSDMLDVCGRAELSGTSTTFRVEMVANDNLSSRLENAYRDFCERSLRLITGNESASVRDRVDYLTEIASVRTKRLLAASSQIDQLNGLKALEVELKRHPAAPYALFETFYKYAALKYVPDIQQSFEFLFKASVTVSDGTLLSRSRVGQPLSTIAEHLSKDHYDIRIAVHGQWDGEGALLGIDIWKSDGGEPSIAIVWRHKEAFVPLVEFIFRAFRPLPAKSRLHLFTRLDASEFWAESDRIGEMIESSGTLPDIEYAEFHFGRYVLFADAQMLDEKEMQCGIVTPLSLARQALTDRIPQIISETSAIVIDQAHVQYWISKVLALLEKNAREKRPN